MKVKYKGEWYEVLNVLIEGVGAVAAREIEDWHLPNWEEMRYALVKEIMTDKLVGGQRLPDSDEIAKYATNLINELKRNPV
jgi:hypothetical protein